jgi:hypothetical protein
LARRKKAVPWEVAEGPSAGRRAAKAVLLLLAVGAAAAGLAYGFFRLGALVQGHPEYLVRRSDLVIVRMPAWIPPDARAELDIARLDPALPEVFSLLDPALCKRLAACYARSVWVERVERIVKSDPRADPRRRLLVHLRFRRPLAFVSRPDGFVLVDDQAVRLPGLHREPRLPGAGPDGGDLDLLVITGVGSSPPAPGLVWPEPGLQAGLRIVDGLHARRERLHLRTVDVSNVGRRRDPLASEVLLYTAHDTEIRWGRAPTPQAARLQEPTVAQKADYLDYVYQSVGHVDGVLEYVDIPNEAVRRRSSPTAYRLRS